MLREDIAVVGPDIAVIFDKNATLGLSECC